MPMLAEVVDAIIGGDTHRDTHTLEMITPAGVPVSTLTVDNSDGGFAAALAWIAEHAPGPRIVVGLEGTRSYGAGLARACQAAGLIVVEVERPRRADRRRGKSDPIDAHLAALAVLRLDADQLPTPRADGDREALRILLTARRDLTDERTAKINALRALLLTGTDTDRDLARGRLSTNRLTAICRRRGSRTDTVEQATRRGEAHRLAQRVGQLDRELTTNTKTLTDLIARITPDLLTKTGVGPISAAQAITSFSHPGRCRNDAAYAALGGVNPIPASSGRTTRHRLNRGGDRQLNRALHDIAKTRMIHCARTRAYVERRRAQGLTDRDIRRCLKRYIARELYHHLNTAMTLDNT